MTGASNAMRGPTKSDIRRMEKYNKAQSDANDINRKRGTLKKYMFTDEEINTVCQLLRNGCKMSSSDIERFGIGHEMALKLQYLYNIGMDKIVISSKEDLCKHLRKMFGKHKRIGISDLALSKLNTVPRKALVGGIKDERFNIYNSNRYPLDKRMYKVESVSGKRVNIITNRRPIIKKGESKKVDGVIEIKSVLDNKALLVSVDKNYVRLCNRFIIVASLRKPEYHHGLVEIICKEGTKVYVYASTMNQGERPSYKGGTQRVYDYGFYKKDIKKKLINVASALYKYIGGVYKSIEPANCDFKCINEVKTAEEMYTEDDDGSISE